MSGISTQGAQIRVSGLDESPLNYEDIGCLTDFQGPSGSRTVIDTTCLDSTGREKNVGIPDYGQVTANGILSTESTDFHVSDAKSLWESFKDGQARAFRLIIPTSPEKYMEFNAYVLNFQITTQIDDVFKFSVTFEIDGAVADNF
jgi:predicted secreted protein